MQIYAQALPHLASRPIAHPKEHIYGHEEQTQNDMDTSLFRKNEIKKINTIGTWQLDIYLYVLQETPICLFIA